MPALRLPFLISVFLSGMLGLCAQEAALPVATPPLAKTGGVDSLPQEALQEAFRALQRGYIETPALKDAELNRAALAGLLQRLEFGARLLTAEEEAARYEAQEIIAFQPEKSILYLQVGPTGRDQVLASRKQLEKAQAEGTEVLLLDLRGDTGKAPFADAASFLDLFIDRSQRLFEIRRPTDARGELFISKVDPVWEGEIVVLVGEQSGANAEVTAAILQHYLPKRTRILGAKTRGAAVRYERATLPGGAILEFAVAEVLLPDGSSFYRQGVSPDFSFTAEAGSPPASWDAVSKILSPILRPRFNEAALVAGTYPELSYKLARSAGETTSWDVELPQDRTLAAAFDMIRSTRFLVFDTGAGEGAEEPLPLAEEEEPDEVQE